MEEKDLLQVEDLLLGAKHSLINAEILEGIAMIEAKQEVIQTMLCEIYAKMFDGNASNIDIMMHVKADNIFQENLKDLKARLSVK